MNATIRRALTTARSTLSAVVVADLQGQVLALRCRKAYNAVKWLARIVANLREVSPGTGPELAGAHTIRRAPARMTCEGT